MEPDGLSTMDGKLKSNTGKMDEYDKKFAEMQKYIPFLEAMIERLQNVKDKSREIQLQKMQSLHGILSNSKRKLKIETLQRCEDVLQKLHNKVEKFQGNAPGLHVPNKKSGDASSQPVTSLSDSENRDKKSRESSEIEVITTQQTVEETPASPSPSVSPETVPQTAPIIIPTERNVDPILDICDKHVNSNEGDVLNSIKPIIIPTERTCDINTQSPSLKTNSREDNDELVCSEWDMLEESEVQSIKGRNCWNPVSSSSHDVSNAAKLVGNSLPQKNNEVETLIKSRHIATVPVPSLGGSRRLSSVLEKTMLNLDTINTNSRAESPVNTSEIRLESPDPDILFPKPKNISSRGKDGFSTPKSNLKSAMPLLVSPPPVSTEPPLSIEDLAELLSEEVDAKNDKKDNQLRDNVDSKKSELEKTGEEPPLKKDTSLKKVSSNIDLSTTKQHLLSQDDIDRESDRRWEEVDKHIVKLTTRKCLPNLVQTTSTNVKSDILKTNEMKIPLTNQHNFPLNVEKSVDRRHQSPSPSKSESRYAENYERHPRQSRDNINDKILSPHSRLHDEDVGNTHVMHGGSIIADDRNAMLYQRRGQAPNVGDLPRIDHPGQQEHFNRQSVNPSLWPPSHPSSTNDFCNSQWTPPNNYSGMGGDSMRGMPMGNPMYQQHSMGMHQDTWNSGINNSIPMDSHPMNDSPIRSNHFNANVMPGMRPLLSSSHSRPQELSHDDPLSMNTSVIPPLLSPTNFSVPSQYRGFHDIPFDRSVDYPIPRQSWDQSMGRPNDGPYRNDPEMNCNKLNVEGMMGMPNSYVRPSTPCPWARDRDRSNRGRGRDGYYNDRCRGEGRNNFSRDGRSRNERLRDMHSDWDNCSRFNRDNRIAVSDRDPRLRDHGMSIPNPTHNRENNGSSVRDPRLSKDKHLNANKFKDNAYQERDPRKRSMSSSIPMSSLRRSKQKSKSKKSELQRRDSESSSSSSSSSKQMNEKTSKDKMQSPLESLYGVIDTKGKSNQSYGLQKFKIPKIKRAEQSTHSNKTNEEKKIDVDKASSEKDDATAEVTSSSDVPRLEGNWDLDDTACNVETVPSKKEDNSVIEPTDGETLCDVSSPTTSSVNKVELKFEEPDSITNVSVTSPENVDSVQKDDTELDEIKLKDGVTQEWIEGLIRKSLEFGEGKKLFEQAKLIQKLGEALEAKKLKKIKKIIESESESSSSDKDGNTELKKVQLKKKRRVIVSSDSSDEDCLAERLGTLTNLTHEEKENNELDKDNASMENSVTVEEDKKNVVSDSNERKDTDHDVNINVLEESYDALKKSETTEHTELKDDLIKYSEISHNKEEIEEKQHDIKETHQHQDEPDVNEQYTIMEDTSTSNDITEDKESLCTKTSKPKTRRRNSLEMLQEDIREMFISEGVVTATGHRMCRVLKENQGTTSTMPFTSTPNQILKKEEPSKSPDKQNVDTDNEEQVSNISKSKKVSKIRSNEKPNKLKSKSKKEVQRFTRQRLKELNFSSDSEEDQPLSLRTTTRDSSNSRNLEVLKEDNEKDQDAEVLRRSKRVLRKEITKEPRVLIEKTDTSKIDSSKTMFDSSSDESFGIDVAELAAAVDISLNAEKKSSRNSSQVVSIKDKSNVQNITKKKCKRKRSTLSTIEKVDDITSFTDEESIISDISMSSSITSGKKVNNNVDKSNNSEELLSDILVGLVSPKTSKDNSQVNKGSDADADEDINDSVRIEQGQKKILVKKKKKKCNWQMGILSKKKRKKAVTSTQSESDRIVPEIQGTLEKITIQEDKSVILQGLETSTQNVTQEEHMKDSVLSPVNSKHNDSNDKIASNKETDALTTIDSISVDNISISISESDTKIHTTSKVESKELPLTTNDDKISVNKNTSLISKQNQSENKTQLNLDIKQLIEYAWTGQERYKCLICSFNGKNIVHHYKLSHPGKEILISRLQLTEAKAAIEEAKQINYEEICTKSVEEKVYSFNCRICCFSTEGAKDAAMEAFYEHCTTHTGEYRFQCNNCSYQTVTKTSMRTHYYKVCRKYSSVFNEAITEDKIPQENSIYGYLCSKCNYVQLKRSNLQTHIEIFHHNTVDIDIIKINMSTKATDTISPIVNNMEINLLPSLKIEKCETSSELLDQENNEQKDDAQSISNDHANIEVNEKTKSILKEKDQEIPKNNKVDDIINKDMSNTAPKCEELLSDKGSELAVSVNVNDKLSVFVCPPELEHKDVEIQLERKKKMQEIVKNFGIKVHKDVSKKGKSIIDTLKDKMETNLHTADEQNKDPIPTDSSLEIQVSNDSAFSTTPILSQKNSNTIESCISSDKTVAKENTLQLNELDKVEEQDNLVKNDSNLNLEKGNTQDSLISENINKKIVESEIETSDNETTRESATIYDSDSSSEPSDTEITTDVNTILKETSSITTSSKDPMMTTIQRLAAQLQSIKSHDGRGSNNSAKVQTGKVSLSTFIPKPPNVIPISSIKHLLEKQDKKVQGTAPQSTDCISESKNFIRFRRLSGDMLSVPTQPSESQEDVLSLSGTGSQSDTPGDILQTDTEEECSFLKIENVVSLAPSTENIDSESTIISDIRKAVETSPVKCNRTSLLKKTSPLILKRAKSKTIKQPITKRSSTQESVQLIPVQSLTSPIVSSASHATSYLPIVPKSKIIHIEHKLPFQVSVSKSSAITPVTTHNIAGAGSTSLSNVNYKILKVVRTSPILKTKDFASQSIAIKLKSSDAYAAMLKPTKLSQLYKCMGRDCFYTTDSIYLYYQHYTQHKASFNKKKDNSQCDYQKCAYCYMVLNDWTQMKEHMEEKHAHCRYQCNSCFYRAITPSYVQIHQAISHPGKYAGILLGKQIKELPKQEEYNRHDYIQPFMCQNDCGKIFYIPETFISHLKIKHLTISSVFKCHLCTATYLKIDQLIAHYKIHGIAKYQCLYCLNGADSFSDMLTHLSLFHCNRLPQILERSLPAHALRNKDVIDQLIIRTLDIKIPTEVIEVKNEADKQEKDLEFLSSTSSQSQEEISILDDQTSIINEGSTSILKKISYSSTSKSSDAIHSSNSDINLSSQYEEKKSEFFNLSRNCASNLDQLDRFPTLKSTITSEKSCNQNENYNFSKHILHEAEFELLPSMDEDINAVDPLGLSNTLDCSDEFININLLDNPNFLKSSRDTSYLSDDKKSMITESKTDDSDIEILEHIESSKDNNEKKEVKKNKKPDESVQKMLDTKSIEDNTEKQQVDVLKITEASNNSQDINVNSSNTRDKSDEPLTLEDIKDTGFTGDQLYKCGYENCNFSASTATTLRVHVKECTLGGIDKNLNCTHCGKRFVKIGFLLEHLKLHGLKRFGCSLCKARCTVSYQAIAHMKTKHKFPYSKVVPANPENPSADGLFVVHPIRPSGERRGKKRKLMKASEKDTEKTSDTEKLSYGPDEIDLLPRQAIYNRQIQCAVCPYTTKVRTNIIRHLQLHAKDETVPETGPVNPVPCLDKKERMFDKMVNLASSSHQNGRMGGKPKDPVKDNDESFIPKFIPEHKRYVCGVAECNYLTVDEAMLRYHLKALHSDEQYFRCPHCPQPLQGQEAQNIAIDKMGVHLKMHDTRLYKCSHCNHHHYHRHIIERHLSDKHPEKRPFVKVIRELENTENIQQPTQDEVEEEIPDPDGNHWKCNICEYKCVYKAEMITHVSVSHDEKNQFKCTACSFKTSGKMLFEQHIASKHPNDSNADYIMVYQRIKGVNKKYADSSEQGGQDEPFDTTPLWRRDMPRIRHIRGILLEDEEDIVLTETSAKAGKRKSDTDLVPARPAKMKHGKSISVDENKHCKEKSKRSLSCEKISLEVVNSDETISNRDNISKGTITNNISNAREKTSTSNVDPSIEVNDFNDSDVGRFGPYGKPAGNMYLCTLCDQYKTKYKHDMRDHLYRELNYARWHCKDCGFLSVNRNALLKHFTRHHNGERPNHAPLSPDNAIEKWVSTLLKRQTDIMKGLSLKKDNKDNTILQSNTTDVVLPESVKKKSIIKSDCNITNKVSDIVEHVDLEKKIYHDTITITDKNSDIDTYNDDNIDDNDDDNDSSNNLVIAINDDDESYQEKDEYVSQMDGSKDILKTKTDKPLICKHCKMKFARWRGLKLHVQITHLKRLGFLCPYCDRSTNSEALMRQHIRSKHPGCIEKIINNPAAGGPELDNEFWEKEYGIIIKTRSRKRKRKVSNAFIKVNSDNKSHEVQDKCNRCGFTAMSYAGLKAHMRVHASKTIFKCQHCTFSSPIKAELGGHWELSHPHLPFLIKTTSIEDTETTSGNIKRHKCQQDDEDHEIKEECHTNDNSSKETFKYTCYYCKVQSNSIDTLQKHWVSSHQTSTSDELTEVKVDLPFKYKEINKPISHVKNVEDNEQRKVDASSNTALQNVNSKLKQSWTCQWCKEICLSENAVKAHQNMFHSHLPFYFKNEDGEEVHKEYVCPICCFTTVFINSMRKHASKHINLFKCKHCGKTFSNPTQVETHNTKEHPKLEVKIESITNYKELLENIMAKIIPDSMNQRELEDKTKQNKGISTTELKIRTVARKSTAMPTIRVRNTAYKVKAVARKSTHPLPRYLPGTSFCTNNYKNENNHDTAKSKQYSFYGIPSSPVNLGQLNTYMVVGGHRMKVNCTTLAQLININPQIKLKDIKYDVKYISVFQEEKNKFY